MSVRDTPSHLVFHSDLCSPHQATTALYIPSISIEHFVSELDQTLLGFSKGTHIGKLVVNFQTRDSLVKMGSSGPSCPIRSGCRINC